MSSLFRAITALRTVPNGTRLFHSYVNEISHPIPGRTPKFVTAEEAVSVVKSGKF